MAKEQEQEKQEEKKQPEQQQPKEKTKMLQWIIPAAVVVLLAVAGFLLGNIFGTTPTPIQAEGEVQPELVAKNDMLISSESKTGNEGWYYDLNPVATNLSDPGSTRYIRAVLTLEMSSEANREKAVKFLDEKKPIIANILNIYFAGLSVEDINSDKDMKRIQYELLEIFNETLYHDSKPLIQQVLFREFGLQ
jgi:flagellar basal body-associated protein FliL